MLKHLNIIILILLGISIIYLFLEIQEIKSTINIYTYNFDTISSKFDEINDTFNFLNEKIKENTTRLKILSKEGDN